MIDKTDARRQTCRVSNLPPILISDGEKGGVGKSFVSRVLAYLLSSNGFGWQGFDLDPRNGHLFRFHKQMGVTQLDWTLPVSWENLFEGIMRADKSCAVLIDLPAQSGPVLAREYPRLQATASYIGRPLLCFWCLSHEFDSVNLLSQSLKTIPTADTFALKNLRNADRDDFALWTKSKTRARLLDGGGTEIYLPRLSSGVANAIEAADIPLIDAKSRLKEPWYQYDIEAYLAEVSAEFAPVVRRLA